MVAAPCLYSAITHTVAMFFADYTAAAYGAPASVISNTLAPDCKRYFRPASFNSIAGFPSGFYYTNEVYEASVGPELSVTKSANWTIITLSVDEHQRKASALTEYRVTLCGTDEYFMEFDWHWDFDETGTKITNIIEYVDPIVTLQEAADAAQLAASGMSC